MLASCVTAPVTTVPQGGGVSLVEAQTGLQTWAAHSPRPGTCFLCLPPQAGWARAQSRLQSQLLSQQNCGVNGHMVTDTWMLTHGHTNRVSWSQGHSVWQAPGPPRTHMGSAGVGTDGC